jgi:nitrogen fixation NifU-like protein
MEDLYRQNILDHYHNPRNFGTLENPDITYEDSNTVCGDEIRLDLRVRDGVIEDVRFNGRGCAIWRRPGISARKIYWPKWASTSAPPA